MMQIAANSNLAPATADFVGIIEAARLCGLSPKHLRRVVLEAKKGIRMSWKGRAVLWRGEGDAVELALSCLPAPARDRHHVDAYHLFLALPEHVERAVGGV